MIPDRRVKALRSIPIDYTVIPDRIEAGTFMLAAAVSEASAPERDYPGTLGIIDS